jgi:hypothetical protein
MAKFIQSDVAGGVILAGNRAGQTAACAGICVLLMESVSCMLIARRSLGAGGFVTEGTSLGFAGPLGTGDTPFKPLKA